MVGPIITEILATFQNTLLGLSLVENGIPLPHYSRIGLERSLTAIKSGWGRWQSLMRLQWQVVVS